MASVTIESDFLTMPWVSVAQTQCSYFTLFTQLWVHVSTIAKFWNGVIYCMSKEETWMQVNVYQSSISHCILEVTPISTVLRLATRIVTLYAADVGVAWVWLTAFLRTLWTRHTVTMFSFQQSKGHWQFSSVLMWSQALFFGWSQAVSLIPRLISLPRCEKEPGYKATQAVILALWFSNTKVREGISGQ